MDRVKKLIGLCREDGSRVYPMLTGKGIGTAVIDTGISPHVDFGYGRESRIRVFRDFVNSRPMLYDDSGHGTHVAGVIAGNGQAMSGRFSGIAPGADLIIAKALEHNGNGNATDVIGAIEWILKIRDKYNIRIVNISIGTGIGQRIAEDSRLVRGVERLWEEGIVVCAAAGNNGPIEKSIAMPGISRKIITVGAMDDDVKTVMENRIVRNYSGRGPTLNAIVKPEIVAPGSNVISCYGLRGYSMKSGTSMSTPVVSGLIALLLEKNPYMTNVDVKKRLKKTAKDIGKDKKIQGWGAIDAVKFLSL